MHFDTYVLIKWENPQKYTYFTESGIILLFFCDVAKVDLITEHAFQRYWFYVIVCYFCLLLYITNQNSNLQDIVK